MKTHVRYISAIGLVMVSLPLLYDRFDSTAAQAQEPQVQQEKSNASPTAVAEQEAAPSGSLSNQPSAKEKDSDPASPASQDFSDRDCAALGLLLGPCPGQGVCVLETMPGSPSDLAGIEPGDYILAVNEQTVSSPKEFMQEIDVLNSVDTVKVSVWRLGQISTKQVRLAAEAKELPASQRTWLGVMLSGGSDQEPGVAIQRVQSGGPAALAGLRSGDRITKINGDQVEAVEKLVEMVQDYEPGDKLELTVQRGDQHLELSAELGDVRNAPLQWFRQSFRMPMDEGDSTMESISDDEVASPTAPEIAVMEEVIEDMRQQIRALQKQVDGLGKPAAPAVDNALEGVEQPPAGPSDQADLSNLEPRTPKAVKLVQYEGRRRFPSSSRNDWRGSRYDRGYRSSYDRYRGSYRRDYGNRGYRAAPYRYYNYGGRPYYYGGSYPFGYRGGVQIGPNFSIWW